MMRFVMPVIFVGIGIAVFFVFAIPIYNDIGVLKTQAASYDVALNNSKALESARDALTQKENSINPDNLLKLKKLLPENIDNIRLILEIEQIASPYGMELRDVKYEDTPTVAVVPVTPGVVQGGAPVVPAKDYGVWNLSFSTTGNYSNFLNFMRDLENNLRIVDVSSIDFTSTTAPVKSTSSASSASSATPALAESYRYDFKIKTYWLKD